MPVPDLRQADYAFWHPGPGEPPRRQDAGHQQPVAVKGDTGSEQGYPNNLQRDDGAIVTVYYADMHFVGASPRPEGLPLELVADLTILCRLVLV